MGIIENYSDEFQLGRELGYDRERCMRYLHKYFEALSEEERAEVYSQSMLAFWEKVHRDELQVQSGQLKVLKNGELVDLNCMLSSYLTGIYKNQALNYIRDHHKHGETSLNENSASDTDEVQVEEAPQQSEVDTHSIEDDAEEGELNLERIDMLTSSGWCNYSPEQVDIINKLVLGLGSPCSEILWATFAEDLSSAQIADDLGYGGARSVITQRSRCIDRLKTRFNQIKDRFYAQ